MPAELTPQDRRALRKIAERLSRVEKAQRRYSRPAQAPYRSIEGGSTDVYDDDGVLRGVIGEQADGTYTRIDLNAPPPPEPAAPSVDGGAGVLTVTSYGLTADLSDWPLDFRRLDVHVGAPGFVHSAGSKVAEFTVDGGAVTLALPAGTYEALLVAVNTSGTESPPSGTALGVVTAPTVGAGGITTYHTPEPPIGLDASADGALWYDTDASNLPHRWDGDTLTWVPMPIGPGATTDDVVAGKRVPLDTELSLEWGVPDPATAPELVRSLVRVGGEVIPEALQPCGLVDHAGSWVRVISVYDGAAYRVRAAFTDQTTGETTYGPLLVDASGGEVGGSAQGIARVGSRWYVQTSKGGAYGIYVYEDDWTFVTSWPLPGSFPSSGNVGPTTDGTSLIVVVDATTIQHRDPDTGTITSTVDLSGVADLTTGSGPHTVAYGSFDFGAPRYLLTVWDGATSEVIVVDAAGVEQTAERFATLTDGEGYPVSGLAWDGTTFAVGLLKGTLWSTVADLTTRDVWAAYSAFDSDPSGGTHETAPSPITAAPLTLGPREGLRVVTEPLPLLDETETPDTVRVYTYTGTGPPTEADLHLNAATPGPSDTEWYVETPANVGAAPPTASTFPVGPSGQQASEVGGYVVRGDGTGGWPYLVQQILAQVEAAFAAADHTHLEYDNAVLVGALEVRVGEVEAATAALESADTALDTRVDTLESADAALDARVDTLEAVDPWHEVGTTGEPAYLNGWAPSSTHKVEFRKTAADDVYIRGRADIGTTGTAFVLPVGYRPSSDILNVPLFASGSTFCNVNVRADGTVELNSYGSATWVGLTFSFSAV